MALPSNHVRFVKFLRMSVCRTSANGCFCVVQCALQFDAVTSAKKVVGVKTEIQNIFRSYIMLYAVIFDTLILAKKLLIFMNKVMRENTFLHVLTVFKHYINLKRFLLSCDPRIVNKLYCHSSQKIYCFCYFDIKV